MTKSGKKELVCVLLVAAIVANGIVGHKHPFQPRLSFCDKLPDKCFKLLFEFWPEACNYTCSPKGELMVSGCQLWGGLLSDIPQCENLRCQSKHKPIPTQTVQQEYITESTTVTAL